MDANIQTTLAVSVPTLAVLLGVLINNSRLTDLRTHVDQRFDSVNQRFDSMERNLKETWRAELRRVKEVLDGRLKHLEESL